jgi:hypothetical protein
MTAMAAKAPGFAKKTRRNDASLNGMARCGGVHERRVGVYQRKYFVTS